MKIIIEQSRFNITAEIKEDCDVYSAVELVSALLELEGYDYNGVQKAVDLARSKRYYSNDELGTIVDEENKV